MSIRVIHIPLQKKPDRFQSGCPTKQGGLFAGRIQAGPEPISKISSQGRRGTSCGITPATGNDRLAVLLIGKAQSVPPPEAWVEVKLSKATGGVS